MFIFVSKFFSAYWAASFYIPVYTILFNIFGDMSVPFASQLEIGTIVRSS